MLKRLRWRLLLQQAIVSLLLFHHPRCRGEENRGQTQSRLLRAEATVPQLMRPSEYYDPTKVPDSIDVSECILLFAAFCNGNMGDVMQAASMRNLINGLTMTQPCIWYAHPDKEIFANGFGEGEFFGGDSSHILSIGCDAESARQVRRGADVGRCWQMFSRYISDFLQLPGRAGAAGRAADHDVLIIFWVAVSALPICLFVSELLLFFPAFSLCFSLLKFTLMLSIVSPPSVASKCLNIKLR